MAATFERLAAVGGAQHRERRIGLARDARGAATEARLTVEDFLNRHPRVERPA